MKTTLPLSSQCDCSEDTPIKYSTNITIIARCRSGVLCRFTVSKNLAESLLKQWGKPGPIVNASNGNKIIPGGQAKPNDGKIHTTKSSVFSNYIVMGSISTLFWGNPLTNPVTGQKLIINWLLLNIPLHKAIRIWLSTRRTYLITLPALHTLRIITSACFAIDLCWGYKLYKLLNK